MTTLDIDATKICAIRLSKKVFDLLCHRAVEIKQDPNFVVYGQTKDLEKAVEDALPILTQLFYKTLFQEDPLSSLEVKLEAMTTSIDITLRMTSWEQLMRLHPKNITSCQQSVTDALKEQENLKEKPDASENKKLSDAEDVERMFQEMERARTLEHKQNRLSQIIKAGGVCPVAPPSFVECTFDIISQQVIPYYQSVLNKMNEEYTIPLSSDTIVLFQENTPQTTQLIDYSETEENSLPFPPNKFAP